MAEEENKTLDIDSWDDFAGIYMKPEDVKDWPLKVVPKAVEAYLGSDNKPRLDYTTEYGGRDRKIGINSTNRNVIKSKGLTPKQAIGKVLVFDKCRVMNPSTNQKVDSFDLIDIKDEP